MAPKSRHPAPSASKTHDLSGPSTAQAAPPSSAAQAEWEQVRRTLLRLLPASHPAPSPSSSPSDTAPSSSTVASHGPAQLLVHPSLARKVRRAFPGLGGRISAAHYPRPGPAGPAGRADGGAAAAEDGQAPASPPPGQGTALPSAGAATGDAHSQGSSAVEVVLVECEGVPVGHVWAGERARGELLGAGASKGDGAFELIRCASAPACSSTWRAVLTAAHAVPDSQARRTAHVAGEEGTCGGQGAGEGQGAGAEERARLADDVVRCSPSGFIPEI